MLKNISTQPIITAKKIPGLLKILRAYVTILDVEFIPKGLSILARKQLL